MNLTKKEAIEKHEELWQRIYEYYKDENNFIDNNFIDNISYIKFKLIKDKGIKNNCYLCEYARIENVELYDDTNCDFCPSKTDNYMHCLNNLWSNLIDAISPPKNDRSKILELCLKIKNICKELP